MDFRIVWDLCFVICVCFLVFWDSHHTHVYNNSWATAVLAHPVLGKDPKRPGPTAYHLSAEPRGESSRALGHGLELGRAGGPPY